MVEFVYNCLYLKELRSEEVYKKNYVRGSYLDLYELRR